MANEFGFTILSLGTRGDATAWGVECQNMGGDQLVDIRKPRPSMSDLETAYESSPEWIFFAGHYSDSKLYNQNDTVSVKHTASAVRLTVDGYSKIIQQSGPGFKIASNARVIFWGGCSVASSKLELEMMRDLFGRNHLLIGFKGTTGERILRLLFGRTVDGHTMKNHFWKRLNGQHQNLTQVRKSWMEAARDWYSGGPLENRFRAVDPDGKVWKLSGGAVVNDPSDNVR